MRTNGQFRRLVGALLVAVIAIPAGVATAGTPAESPAALGGLVLTVPTTPDAPRRPVEGAVVRALDVASGRSWQSPASGADGAYRLEGLPAGQFALGVETKAGVFLSDGMVGLTPGQQRRLSFSLRAEKADEGGSAGEGEGGETPPADTGKTPPAKGGHGSWWANHPWLGGVAVVGSAVALGVLADQLTNESDNKEKNASPAAP